jgi:hypothetical protein
MHAFESGAEVEIFGDAHFWVKRAIFGHVADGSSGGKRVC